jgi:hypothetical protein
MYNDISPKTFVTNIEYPSTASTTLNPSSLYWHVQRLYANESVNILNIV